MGLADSRECAGGPHGPCGFMGEGLPWVLQVRVSVQEAPTDLVSVEPC